MSHRIKFCDSVILCFRSVVYRLGSTERGNLSELRTSTLTSVLYAPPYVRVPPSITFYAHKYTLPTTDNSTQCTVTQRHPMSCLIPRFLEACSHIPTSQHPNHQSKISKRCKRYTSVLLCIQIKNTQYNTVPDIPEAASRRRRSSSSSSSSSSRFIRCIFYLWAVKILFAKRTQPDSRQKQKTAPPTNTRRFKKFESLQQHTSSTTPVGQLL